MSTRPRKRAPRSRPKDQVDSVLARLERRLATIESMLRPFFPAQAPAADPR